MFLVVAANVVSSKLEVSTPLVSLTQASTSAAAAGRSLPSLAIKPSVAAAHAQDTPEEAEGKNQAEGNPPLAGTDVSRALKAPKDAEEQAHGLADPPNGTQVKTYFLVLLSSKPWWVPSRRLLARTFTSFVVPEAIRT